MRVLKPVLMVVGVVLLALGALFMAQGSDFVRWPSDSFMLGEQVWVTYGAAIAVAGLLLVLLARRIRR